MYPVGLFLWIITGIAPFFLRILGGTRGDYVMNPGYMSLWIIVILIILMATGWKSFIAPDFSQRSIVLFGIGVIALLPFSIWWVPGNAYVHVELHAAAIVLLLAGLLALNDSEEWSYKGYLLLCILMIMFIWGFLRKMYSYDPVFYWIDPLWDAPLLSGILSGAFTSNAKHQFGMIAWGAALGEVLNAILQGASYTTLIGSLYWWDSFWIAIVAAMIFTLFLKVVRMVFAKLSLVLLHLKGGRSS